MKIFDKAGIRIARGLMAPINHSAVIIMALYTMLWGIWVATPVWAVFDRAPLYENMLAAGPEWLWGVIAIISGMVMMYGVLKPAYLTLARGAFTGAIHWLVICVFYFLGDWQNTGGITAGMVSTYCAYVYLNLRLNRENMDFEQ